MGRIWVREYLTQTRPQEKNGRPCPLVWHPSCFPRLRVTWTMEPQVEVRLERQTDVILAKSFDLSGLHIHCRRSRNRLRVLCEN